MSETQIEADVVYDHERHGEVLVTGIAKMYEKMSVNAERDEVAGQTLVFYHNRFDGYGGMQPNPSTEEINEFAKAVSRDRAFEYDSEPELRED